MFYLSDAELDRLLLDDIAYGDLTTRALGIGQQNGQISFCRRQAGRVSGVAIAVRLLQKLALKVVTHVRDGDDVAAGAVLLVAVGNMENLHQGWKVAQNVLEWCGGVAQYMAQMVATAQTINPLVQIACTRKSIPGTKSLAIAAIIDGGGILHRAGTAESILLFANHRRFCAEPDNWEAMVTRLRRAAPEKKVIVEADNVEEALAALNAQADIVQLDKFTPQQFAWVLTQRQVLAPNSLLSAAGGITLLNVADYVRAGAELLVTSAPYYAQPTDIKVWLEPV
ncbi:ModD protein [Snodgrassella communis]|uniref:Putative pyrophosphorylase ModD n=2 Tax=Snodgrassella TaxID=1193515 RepID=A0A2N9XSX3_9NEIS|nr:ModD protein [Snodgrassella communis]KDN14603.1 Molybdenum transport system protein ModD [Snodgrassella communis]PIT08133.1 ModD protein [Snodgrassella communis]PIT26172.1 ModD protein [Snodgrassella communis]PIT26671.1 ModD protein [Snodgrassella communis]PIT35152.1 ModD protein [Snodgrassella communis]